MEHLGIDIGSKTIKIALVEDDGKVVYSTYTMHRSQVKRYLSEAIHSITWRLGDRPVQVTVTGSAGMRVAELFNIPFVQEVVALKRAVLRDYPEADAILEMGGEDTKLVYLTGVSEQRMNTVCAGGTGSFIEMMGGLMGVRAQAMNSLAMGYTTLYPIASRCAVFAKSDVRPLLNAGARKEDVAASVLDAVCTQAVAGLSAGRPLTGTVLLLGGPFQHIPAMRDAFCRVTGFDKKHAIVPPDAHLFVVRGAALSEEESAPMMLSDFERLISDTPFESDEGIVRLEPLFRSKEEYAEFRQRHESSRLPRVRVGDAKRDVFLGVDAGSTTMKLALVDSDGCLMAYEYDWNGGDVSTSLTDMLSSVYRQLEAPWTPEHIIRRSCIVGYGEDFCKAAFGIDDGEVETVAHLRAAYALNPQVDFLMDIGGQDIKCFYIDDGVIEDVVLNEACSSGCGSLFDSVARSMRKSKERFAAEALYAESPVDLGTRCATFMDSRIKHAQKEGVPTEDIAAGVCYSTARNALFKVVRQPDFTKVGEHIVVQGGAFANDALLRAFERETGVEVTRPDLSQIMGAWGAALLARDTWLSLQEKDPEAAEEARSGLISSSDLAKLDIRKSVVRCDQCTNRCKLMITRFSLDGKQHFGVPEKGGDERVFVTGNRCEKGALAYGMEDARRTAPPNMFKVKWALVSSYDRKPQPEGGTMVGIPRALALQESYPFWRTFFNELGCSVVPTESSSEELFRKGMGSIPAEGMCYPAKLMYGHAVAAAEKGAQVVFAPNMTTAFAREGLLGAPLPPEQRACPLVENMGDMLKGNVEGTVLEGLPLVVPDLRAARTLEDAVAPLAAALAEAGLPAGEADVRRALQAASAEYRVFFGNLAKRSARILEAVDAREYPGALVSCHGYHADGGVSHGIDELLGALGYAVLEEVDYGFLEETGVGNPLAAEDGAGDWTESARTLRRIRDSKEHPNLQFIILRSFGCGIDALVADEAHDRLRADDRIYAELKIDQIVDLAAVRIRLRSLAYATRQREGATHTFPLTVPPEAYERGFAGSESASSQPKAQKDTPPAAPSADSRAASEAARARVEERAARARQWRESAGIAPSMDIGRGQFIAEGIFGPVDIERVMDAFSGGKKEPMPPLRAPAGHKPEERAAAPARANTGVVSPWSSLLGSNLQQVDVGGIPLGMPKSIPSERNVRTPRFVVRGWKDDPNFPLPFPEGTPPPGIPAPKPGSKQEK